MFRAIMLILYYNLYHRTNDFLEKKFDTIINTEISNNSQKKPAYLYDAGFV